MFVNVLRTNFIEHSLFCMLILYTALLVKNMQVIEEHNHECINPYSLITLLRQLVNCSINTLSQLLFELTHAKVPDQSNTLQHVKQDKHTVAFKRSKAVTCCLCYLCVHSLK